MFYFITINLKRASFLMGLLINLNSSMNLYTSIVDLLRLNLFICFHLSISCFIVTCVITFNLTQSSFVHMSTLNYVSQLNAVNFVIIN